MYVLVFTLVTTGQVAFYSGDLGNRQSGRPTMFPTQVLCEEVRGPQLAKMMASRKADPKLPAFTLECMSMNALPEKQRDQLRQGVV